MGKNVVSSNNKCGYGIMDSYKGWYEGFINIVQFEFKNLYLLMSSYKTSTK